MLNKIREWAAHRYYPAVRNEQIITDIVLFLFFLFMGFPALALLSGLLWMSFFEVFFK